MSLLAHYLGGSEVIMSKKVEAQKIDSNVIEQIAADVEHAMSLNRQGHPLKARKFLLRAKGAAARAEIQSATLEWACAACSDYLNDASAAMSYSASALRLDPLSPSFRRSRQIIVERLRRTVLDAPPRAVFIPEYAVLLIAAGLEDAEVLFALAAHYAAVGRARDALEVLDKLADKREEAEVLKLRAELHDRLGEHDLARASRERIVDMAEVNMPSAEA